MSLFPFGSCAKLSQLAFSLISLCSTLKGREWQEWITRQDGSRWKEGMMFLFRSCEIFSSEMHF